MRTTILIAPNSYKGSLGAAEAARAIARGLAGMLPEARLVECPLSDGGEGFIETLVGATGGRIEEAETTDALGRPIRAPYAVLDGGDTVALELSAAAGLVQLAPEERNPLVTTTYGVGQLIAAAHERHPFKRLLLALGGSATVDGGTGLLAALGVRFLDAEGHELPLGGGALRGLAEIDTSQVEAWLHDVEFRIAVDVSNPLLGPRGAAPVYAPQKGATPEMVAALEQALGRLAAVLAETTGQQVAELPGTGSAGGVPASLVALAGARMRPGFTMVAEVLKLDEKLAQADWVITGEGQLDRQSFEGKVIGRLAALCQSRRLPLVALCGNLTPEGEALLAEVGGAAFPLVRGPLTLEEALDGSEELLARSAGAIALLARAFASRA